jgi:hypothetical protein
VIVKLPIGSAVVVSVATPPASVPVPSVVAPFAKVTVPVELFGSVAVIVTDWPVIEGLSDEVSATDGVDLPTTCGRVATDALLFPSPPYVAVIVELPTGSDEVVSVAIPFVTVAVPRVVESEVKVTVPVTVEGSVSVNVTALPNVEGLDDEVRTDDGLSFVTARAVVAVPDV